MTNTTNRTFVRNSFFVAFVSVLCISLIVSLTLRLAHAEDAVSPPPAGTQAVSTDVPAAGTATVTDQTAPVVTNTATTSDPTETPVDSTATVQPTTTEQAPVVSAPTTTPEISTDKPDYEPGETVSIFGKFFEGLKTIVVRIFGNSEVGNHLSDVSLSTVTGADGSFNLSTLLDNFYRPLYNITVSDTSGNILASSSFTDAAGASVDEYSQCANAAGTGPCTWTNGDLNSNNSTYHEDDATVQRLALGGLANGSHTVVIEYQTTKGGKHAYDFLTDDTYSEGYISPNAVCDAPVTATFPSCASVSPTSSGLITADSNAAGKDVLRANRHFKIRNGTITTIGTPTIVNGTYAGDSLTDIPVTFTVDTSSCADKTAGSGNKPDTCPVLISWGAHVSSQADWGIGNSAVNIQGSPYHVKVVELDGASTGNRDNQMAASAVVLPNTITIHKVTSPTGATQSFAFTTTGTGYTGFSLTDGQSNTQSPAPGSYTVTETNPAPTYANTNIACTATGTGSSATPNIPGRSVAITIGSAGGAVIDCTYTNTLQQGTLLVKKVVINDNGGTQTAGAFSFQVNGGTATAFNETADGDNNALTGQNSLSVNAGTYTVTEPAVSGYATTYSNCTSVTVTAGQTTTCTVTNNDIAPTLTLVKTVVNDNGGTKAASDFQGMIDGNNVAWGTATTVSAGAHTATETNLSGYTAGNWGGDCASNGSVTLALGQSKTCTITNDDQPATLIVKKVVVNDNGGTKVASDFSFTVNGGSSVPFEADAENDMTVSAGTYSVVENAATGYSTTYDNCSNLVIPSGGSATCTITNNDIQPKLTLTKIVVNDNGGNAVVSDFPLFVGTTGVTSGAQNAFNAGTYTASETNLPGYTAGSWTGDCSVAGSITLAPGDVKSCTITNDDQPAHVILNKVVINNSGGTAGINDFGLTVGGTSVTSGSNTAVNSNTAIALNEAGLSGYNFVSITGDAKCPAALGGTVTLNEGETVTCTITNDDQQAYITVVKTVNNNHGGTAAPNDFKLTLDGTATTSGTAVPVNPGAHTAAETQLAGYTFNGFSGDCDTNGSLTVALGQSKTCTLTNSDIAPTLKLVKAVVNDNGGTKTPADWTLSATGTGGFSDAGNSTTFHTVNAGVGYTLGESTIPGYTASAWSCDSGNLSGNTLTLSLAQNVTCTITNNDTAPILHLRKVVVNDNGGTATLANFTLTADGTGTNDLTGTSPVDSGTTLMADTFALSETNMTGYTASPWSCVGGTMGDATHITLGIGQEATCTITNNDQPAHLIVIKHVINDDGDIAAASDFTMHLTGTALSQNNFPGSETGVNVTLNAGAYSADEVTNAGYVKTLSADCVGTIGVGETKTCTITNNDIPHPTRTLGFWQTHTQYTTAKFAGFGGALQIGTKQIADTNKLFGGFYASIPKKTVGGNRTDIDKARMIMLQQWLAAKLNCQAFTCSAATQTLLTNAANAWNTGPASLIQSYATQLNTYNNSNDALPISGQGSATPKASQALANLVFWDQLP